MQVSAFVDGELPDNEADLLVRRLSQDSGLRRQVSEYLAIGRTMRGEYSLQGSDVLRERIAAELEERPLQEPADPVVADQPSRYVRPVAGAAIAATVALVAIFGLGQVADVDSEVPGSVVADETVSETVPTMNDDELRQYMILHGYDSNSFSTRMTSLQIRAEDIAEEAAAEDPEAEDAADADEPVTSQP
jgi:sigma-E factor negative regulatory protein RseA